MTRRAAVQLLASLVTAVVAPPRAAAETPADMIDAATAEAATAADATAERGGRRKHRKMMVESLAIQAIGTAWYWRNTGDGWGAANHVDWQLGFEGNALEKKLGFGADGWRFDGNTFELNALCHPMFGALTYWAARRNNYGVLESFLVSTLVSGTWELFTEWAEYGSINDALSTSTTGVPIGEAAYQLMRHWRRGRYTLQTGAGSQAGDAVSSVAAHATLDTLPATGEGSFVGGKRVGLALEASLDGAGVRGLEGGAKTSIAGYYRHTPRTRLFAGASAEFYYRDQKQRDSRAWDMLSFVAAGPTVDVHVRATDRLSLDAGADLYVDFGMLKAAAYDNYRAMQPGAVLRNSMQDKERPYYYARGFTAAPRLRVRYGAVEVGGKLSLAAFDSIDGADRDQEMMTADPHIEDTDTMAQGWIGYTRGDLTLAVDRRLDQRRGTMGGAAGEQDTRTTMVSVAFRR